MAVRIVAAMEGMEEAIERLKEGKLVAFPTETVYGLGADARDADAVARIFTTKGRPATNPLIVHVADVAAARDLAGEWTPVADELAAMYWPGAITLVVRKTDAIPAVVTAGGGTVALRVPDHPVALEMLRRSGVPVAAPSANRSEQVSPTTAQHVADSLGQYADDLLILDGGACRVGIESTVVDATGGTPRLLRPGMMHIFHANAGESVPTSGDDTPRSPGQMARHYAPAVPVHVLPAKRLRKDRVAGDGVIQRVVVGQPAPEPSSNVQWLPPDPDGYAAGLYTALRLLDAAGVSRILVEEPPRGPRWDAIHDRLRRAATPKTDVQ
ncbi:MAG: threonylcarbamoyl-AMP synthase [Akkermansiaceae bacterium]|nr:threonylcarbamoyl-AMP synthase [Armatimonadota bacterium]